MKDSDNEFKPIELADREKLLPLLGAVPFQMCDYAFANLYGWQKSYNTHWQIMGEQTLVLRFTNKHYTHPVYMLPHCTINESRIATINQLRDEAIKAGEQLVFFGVTPSCYENLCETFPDQFKYIHSEAAVDYIYTREKLATLKGKKLQAKRNHIHKFDRLYPHYLYEPLDPHSIDEYLAFTDRWLANQTEDPAQSLSEEKTMIHRILRAMDCLELIGGVLRVEGTIVALTVASKLTEQIVDVHIEKANTDYEGAYAKINNEFAQSLPTSVQLINREEDLGIPGLRKAKESYQPDIKLQKGIVVHCHTKPAGC